MDFIVLNSRRGGSRKVHLPPWLLLAGGLALVVVPLLLGAGSYLAVKQWAAPEYGPEVVSRWRQQVADDSQRLDGVLQQSADKMHALELKFADMQARLVRLDALGERLVDVASIESDEFDFNEPPAIGGPDAGAGGEVAYQPPAFVDAIKQLAATLDRRQQQLNILDGLLGQRHLKKDTRLAGRPIDHGWLSSHFGYRTDPFTGKLHLHSGIDFAGKMGTPVHATAAGVVTWSGKRSGYGNMVQIYHGKGISSRYGHCKQLLVKPGDIVTAGQTIALMGSTGRSTGPHVHYEVLKNGRQVDPMPYIVQAR